MAQTIYLDKKKNPVNVLVNNAAKKYLEMYREKKTSLEILIKSSATRKLIHWGYMLNIDKIPPWDELPEDTQAEYYEAAQVAGSVENVQMAVKALYFLSWLAQGNRI